MIRAAILFLVFESVTLAQTGLEKPFVLLPAPIGTVAGGFDSIWSTELWIHNSASSAIEVTPSPCRFSVPDRCSLLIPGGATVQVHPPANDPLYSAMVIAGSDSALHFNLRTRDLSRSAFSAGTEISVVRPNGYLSRKSQLLNVPTDSRFRTTLRIFVPLPIDIHHFTLRAFSMDDGAQLAERTITIPVTALPLIYAGVPIGEATVPVLDPEAPTTQPLPPAVRAEIEPHRTDGLRYWAYITVTNNETQHVTTITPH